MLGVDLVPRLSLVTIERLRDAVVQELATCQQPKARVLGGLCWSLLLRPLRRRRSRRGERRSVSRRSKTGQPVQLTVNTRCAAADGARAFHDDVPSA